jgi:hypothetical protein
MRMYVAILRIDNSWKSYSPDLNTLVDISEIAYYNKDVIEYFIGNQLTVMPSGKYPIIVSTKQYLRANGYPDESFVDCIPVDFVVEERNGTIQKITSAH